jgi:beta-glucosidase
MCQYPVLFEVTCDWRPAHASAPASALPNATAIGASFDTDLVAEAGALLAAETKARHAVCLLAPTINIQRSPVGGRAFESFSEDPTHSGLIAAAYVNGLQAQGVSATIKHFVANDQEHERMGEDSIVAERPLREIYLRPFQIAQKLAKPWAYMTSYNKLNGTHCNENKWLLDTLLRKEWKHEGTAPTLSPSLSTPEPTSRCPVRRGGGVRSSWAT